MKRSKLANKELLASIVKECFSLAEVLRRFNLRPVGGNYEWNGLPIPLELNHINGKNIDNRIENLEILCPNCHAQTEHYRGKSKKVSASMETLGVEFLKFREALTDNADGNPELSSGNPI